MNRFDPEDRAELNELIVEAFGNGGSTAAKGAKLERLLLDAEQAQRPWASVILDECRRQGLISYGRREFQRLTATPVSFEGEVLSMPMALSRRQRDEAGAVVHELRLIEYQSWDDVVAKVRQIARTIRGYEATLAGLLRLLKLREQFPDSLGPADACQLAGTTIAAVVAEAA